MPVIRVKFSRTRRNGVASGPAHGPMALIVACVVLYGGLIVTTNPEELDWIVTCTAWLTAGGALDAPALPAQRASVVVAACGGEDTPKPGLTSLISAPAA